MWSGEQDQHCPGLVEPSNWFDFISRRIALDCCGQSLGSDQHVTVHDELFHFLPVDIADIQPQPDPPLRGNLSGHVESRRIGCD